MIRGEYLDKSTPVFRTSGERESYLKRVWGGYYQDGTWRFPAYYPFAEWVVKDLLTINKALPWDDSAKAHVAAAVQARASWEKSAGEWAHSEPVSLDVPSGFFPEDFTPYQHQRLGIARLSSWWRSALLWDPGTGKTRTAIDALRVRALHGTFRRALVLGPPVVLQSWFREVRRCSKGEWTAVVWDGTLEAAVAASQAQVVLASYTRISMEYLAAVEAQRQLAVSNEQRIRYKTPPLTPEQIAEYQRQLTFPISQLDYDTIVADESHYLGNWKASYAKAAVTLSVKAPRRFTLTGTPGDDPRKLYGQLYFLTPSLIPYTYEQFEDHHLVRSQKNKHVVVGYRALNELNERVNSVSLHMRKKDCLDLPPVVISDLTFDMGQLQRARYNELVLQMGTSATPQAVYATPDQVDETTAYEAPVRKLPHGAARVNKMLQVLSGFLTEGADYSICDNCEKMEECVDKKIRPYTKKCTVVQEAPPGTVLRDIENPKLELFKEQIQVILDADPTNKVLVWANYTQELDDIVSVLKELKIGHVRVDGGVLNRQGRIDKFQEDKDCRVYVGQVRTGIGITLTAANYTIFYSLPWDPLQYQQAMERNNRPGQRRDMVVYRLLTSERSWALDRYVASLLTFKSNIAVTLSELVACSSCDRQQDCAAKEILPFRAACKFAANVAKPVSEVEVVE